MRCRFVWGFGILAALAILPGCRRGKPKPPVSPWLLLEQAPSEEGALGILAGPGMGQQDFPLTGAQGAPLGSVPAVACVSVASPILDGEPSAYPAVFAEHQGRALVWGPSGWGWVDLQAARAQVTTLAGHLEAVVNSTRLAIQERTSAEGWTLHSRWVLTLAPQAVRTEPREDAPYAAAAFPGGCLQGDGVWRTARPGDFAAGSMAKPLPFIKLDIKFAPRTVPEIVARPFERRGDWLQVGFPRPGTSTFVTDAHGVGDSADNPALLVQWSPAPAGWVRLTRPGPVPGTALRQWSWRFLGRRD